MYTGAKDYKATMRSATLHKLVAEYEVHGVFGAMSAASASEVHVLALVKFAFAHFQIQL